MNDNAQPIVIIGAARSGTKFLRGLLQASEATSAVPYDVSYIWRYGNEDARDDALQVDMLSPGIQRFIQSSLRKQAGMGDADRRRLIEKTVGNTLRVPFVRAVFPNAQYIHLVRDGRAVTESAMRMWEAPPDRGMLLEKLRRLPLRNLGYAFWFLLNYVRGIFSGRSGGRVWGPRYPGIDDDLDQLELEQVCARQWARSVHAAQLGLADLGEDQLITVRYEDLTRNPETLEKLLAFLRLPDPEKVRGAYTATLVRNQNDKWSKVFTSAQLQAVLAEVVPVMRSIGYDSGDA